MREALLIGLFGGLGAISRWSVGLWSARLLGDRFPYGTLVVNVTGCLLIGLLVPLSAAAEWAPRAVRTAALVGFLGAFTTFSAFGYQTFEQIEHAAWRPALVNVAAHLVLGLLAVWLGIAVGRWLVTAG